MKNPTQIINHLPKPPKSKWMVTHIGCIPSKYDVYSFALFVSGKVHSLNGRIDIKEKHNPKAQEKSFIWYAYSLLNKENPLRFPKTWEDFHDFYEQYRRY